jgi:BlaI family penicillinase repressor
MMELPQITEAEWEVMKVVWEGPATAGEVVRRMEGVRGWRPRTIKTLLGRLVRKGAVKMEAQEKRYLYKAAVRREACVRSETRSFLSRVFDGAVAPALVQFLKESKLSAAELDELREILEKEAQRASDSIWPGRWWGMCCGHPPARLCWRWWWLWCNS